MTAAAAIDKEMGARFRSRLAILKQLLPLLKQDHNFSIPGVVVVGARNAGKSSVLEALSGVKLPRGQNHTARVPLIVSLEGRSGAPTYTLISNEAGMRDANLIDVEDVGCKIEALTAKLARTGTRVSRNPIHLRVVHSSGPTLTLVDDLPDIPHKPHGQRQRILKTNAVYLAKKYTENKNMLILAVIPAMDDFAKAEAIALAKRFDPEGRRTLGVVTKVDNIQPGCDIKAKLQMDPGHVRLRLGFIAVVNRSPDEVERDTSAEEVREREKQFFETNWEVAGLEKGLWGIDTLAGRIVEMQAERIEAMIPGLVRRARERISQLSDKLRGMPRALVDHNERRDTFREVISSVADQPKSTSPIGAAKVVRGVDLRVGPRVMDIFAKYAEGILKDVKPDFLGVEYSNTIREALERVEGTAASDQQPGCIFNLLFGKAFSGELEGRSHNMVGRVRIYMQSVLQTRLEHACKKYPALLNEVGSLAQGYMEKKEEETARAVSDAVKSELDWVFAHPAYTTTIDGVCHMVQTKRETRSGSEGSIQTWTACGNAKDQDIRSLQACLFGYSERVFERVFTAVFKHAYRLVSDSSGDGLVPWMLKEATREDLDHWFRENPKTLHKREKIARELSLLQRGVIILDSAHSMET